ncbi:Nn.00g103740.m01.CDS01 [Neocucurbitaria sp. VM-36]
MDFLLSSCCWPALRDPDPDHDDAETAPLLSRSNLRPYAYQPLAPDEIRLLVLHPARDFENELVVHLQILKRSEEKYFEAVSYVWGVDEATVQLPVHDEQHATSFLHGQNFWTKMYRYQFLNDKIQAALRVRANVATMLRYLRYPWLPRYLWIDQICINQNDNDEKSQQVNQMGDIYRMSGRTLIWLGCSKTHRRPLSALETTWLENRPSRRRDAGDDMLEEGEEEHYTRLRPEVRRILALPWFQRRWVIQEVALSSRPRVIFGYDQMSFEDMTYFIDQLRKVSYDIAPQLAESIRNLETMTSLFRRRRFRGTGLLTNVKHDVFHQYYRHHPKSNDAADFVQLLVSMHTARCSDDRDRLYALNSLRQNPMVVDYQRTTEEVYSSLAVTECTNSLETLYCSGAFPSQNLPSWVPDWRSSRQWIPIKAFEGRRPSHHLLSDSPRRPNPPSQRPLFIGSRTMVINAITFTFVALKGPQLYENWTFNPWLCITKYLEFYKRATGPRTRQNDIDDIQSLDRLLTTLTAGSITSGENLQEWLKAYDSPQSYKRARRTYLDPCCECKDISICAYSEAHSNVFNILERIEQVLKGRCTFITDRGDWAVGPAPLLSGDIIVAIPGCRYPFVMRQKGPAAFTIVGDCYMAMTNDLHELLDQSISRSISIV